MKLICNTDKLKSVQKGVDYSKYVLKYAKRVYRPFWGLVLEKQPIESADLVQLSINGKANIYKLSNFILEEESKDK